MPDNISIPTTGETAEGTGATFRPVYADRNMMGYLVTESEMKTLASQHTLSTFFFSVGSLAVGVLLSCITTTPTSDNLAVNIAYRNISLAIAILSYAGGAIVLWHRGDAIQLIKDESTKTKGHHESREETTSPPRGSE